MPPQDEEKTGVYTMRIGYCAAAAALRRGLNTRQMRHLDPSKKEAS